MVPTHVSIDRKTQAATPAHSSVSVGAIVGGVLGGIAGAIAFFLALILYLRRRRQAGEVPMHENKFELSSLNRARLVPEPYVLASHPRPPMQSKGSYSQVADTNSLDSSPRMQAISSTNLTAPTDRALSAETSTVGTDGSVLFSLARRLGDLENALAIRGHADDSPPEYDGRHTVSHGAGRS